MARHEPGRVKTARSDPGPFVRCRRWRDRQRRFAADIRRAVLAIPVVLSGCVAAFVPPTPPDTAQPLHLCSGSLCSPVSDRLAPEEAADLLRLIFHRNAGRTLSLCATAADSGTRCLSNRMHRLGPVAEGIEVLDAGLTGAPRDGGRQVRLRMRMAAALFGRSLTCRPTVSHLAVGTDGSVRWHLAPTTCPWTADTGRQTAAWSVALDRVDLAAGHLTGRYRAKGLVPAGGGRFGTVTVAFEDGQAVQDIWQARLLERRAPPSEPPTAAATGALQIPGEQRPHRRRALVIGNGTYAFAPLPNPVNDGRAMAEALGEVGFTVSYLENADRASMAASIQRLATGGRDAVLLLYFAGHGMRVGGRNYLLPVDAAPRRTDELARQALPVDTILARLRRTRPHLILAILDACQNNPFEAGPGAAQLWQADAATGFGAMRGRPDTLIAFATRPGATALDGHGRNSVYTKHLLRHLRRPQQTLAQFFRRVARGVLAETDGAQRPWTSTAVPTVDFAFVPAAAGSDQLSQRRQ